MEEQLAFVVRPKVKLTEWNTKNNPKGVMGACRKAARAGAWSLAAWDEFAATAWSCLAPAAAPEEMALFMVIVRERFDVTEAPGFSCEAEDFDSRTAD